MHRQAQAQAFVKVSQPEGLIPMQGSQFQTEVFEKVERPYMLGLRASTQDMRRKFFQIYNKSIPTPLFDRLQFLICTQSWEKLAGTFWLKEALVSLCLCPYACRHCLLIYRGKR